MKFIALATLAMGAAVLAYPAEDPAVKDRKWWINLQAPTQTAIQGRFDGIENGFVWIRQPDGERIRVMAANIGWADNAYVQRRNTRLPAKLAKTEPTDTQKPWIELSASALRDGAIREWKNTGSLGGAFHVANKALPVETIEGRKGVRFFYGPWNLPLEFPAMVADVQAPKGLSKGPFTVSAWLYNPSQLGQDLTRETVLSWHTLGGDDGTDIGYGTEGRFPHERGMVGGAYCGPHGGFGFPDAVFPRLNQWHHIVYVSGGKRNGTFKLFVDGRKGGTFPFRRSVSLLPASKIGQTEATVSADLYLRDRKPVPVTVLVGETDTHYLRDPQFWTVLKDLGPQKPGRVSFKATGLKPGTRYFYRFVAVAPNETRWSDGAMSFVTAATNKPGRADPKDEERMLFLGTSWGSQWDWTVRPRWGFTGWMSSLRLFGRAMSDAEVSALCAKEGAKPLPATKTIVASPKPVSPFQLEADGLASAPFPEEIWHNGYYGKIMEAAGQHVISTADCPDEAMALCSYTMSKMMRKRPDLTDTMFALNCGASLAYGNQGSGQTELMCWCYGDVRTFQYDPTFYWGINIMFHEMGHQFHAWAAEQTEPDFRKRLYEVFWANKRKGLWIGDYAGFNIWEYVACVASAFCSDGDPEDVVTRRETLRRTDPAMYHFLSDYWPGDKLIELLPGPSAHLRNDGTVGAWDNLGGLEYWGKFGLAKHARSVGTFNAKGSPAPATVDGVAAIQLKPADRFAWTCRTREFLVGNLAWSIEGWLFWDGNGLGQVVAFGAGDDRVRLTLGTTDTALDLGSAGKTRWRSKPSPGNWHHVVARFGGGGLANGPGHVSVWVDGVIDHVSRAKLNLSPNLGLTVGGGFSGAIGQLRVHDYALGDSQIRQYFEEQSPWFARDPVDVAGKLAIDLDARALAPSPRYETRPTYPETSGKPWLRSWANRGTLGGKLRNETSGQSASQPIPGRVAGLTAVAFDGNDRMVSDLPVGASVARARDWTLEGWVLRDGQDKDGVFAQIGPFRADAKNVPTGRWVHVAWVASNDLVLQYVDGQRVGKQARARFTQQDRLIVGSGWNGKGFERPFRGAVSQLRLHLGALDATQIARQARSVGVLQAQHPEPADGTEVVVDRKPAFGWTSANGEPQGEVFLGTDPSELKSLGWHRPGACVPPLEAGQRYFWRVDINGIEGKVWTFRTADGLVLDLSADNLQPGQVQSWANLGSAGGRFAPFEWSHLAAPSVIIKDGVKAVDLSNGKRLVSSFALPTTLESTGWTMAYRVYAVQVPNQATVLEIAGLRLNYGRNDQNGALLASDGRGGAFRGPVDKVDDQHTNAPLVNTWHDMVVACEPGPNAKVRVFVNGRQKAEGLVGVWGSDARMAIGRVEEGFPGHVNDVRLWPGHFGPESLPKTSPWVSLTAQGLAMESKVPVWRNQGTLGGSFSLEPKPSLAPVMAPVEGRNAVVFADGSFLRSDQATPSRLTGIRPVTVEAWVWNPDVAPTETFFSLAPRQAMAPAYLEEIIQRAFEFRYGQGGPRDPAAFHTGSGPRNLGWKDAQMPEAGRWHHLAFVYDGRPQGWMRLYVDGRLENEKGWTTLATIGGLPMFLGTAWNTDYGPVEGFTGALASLKAFDYAKTADEIAASALER